jgi:hypothetical protein
MATRDQTRDGTSVTKRSEVDSRSKRDRLRRGAATERVSGDIFCKQDVYARQQKCRRERCDIRGDVACPTRFERAAFRVGVHRFERQKTQ